jgi:hypothetical protein
VTAPVSLSRETPAVRQAGGAAALGICLLALGGVMLYVLRQQSDPATTDWLVSTVGTAFSLVGVMTLALALKMLIAARTPETRVEVDRLPVAAGATFLVTMRQPGPVRLYSLRLNLTAEQVTTRVVYRRGRRDRDRDRRLIYQHNLIDTGPLVIARGEELIRQAEATMPASLRLADVEGDKAVVWRLEVWGKVQRGVDFGHPFVLDVRGLSTADTSSPAA